MVLSGRPGGRVGRCRDYVFDIRQHQGEALRLMDASPCALRATPSAARAGVNPAFAAW